MDKRRLDDGTVLVGFELPAAVGATSVSLVGEFNDWSAVEHPLTRLGDGGFRTEVSLQPGRRWHFRYLVDGDRWENDWAADAYESNGLGADDSVVDLTDLPEVETLADVESAPAAEAHSDPTTDSDPKPRWWRFWSRRTTEPAQA